jgi:non-canonical (house-cleaning) NTP pyrophosphatase
MLQQIEASLLHEVFMLHTLRRGGKRLAKNAIPRAEKALQVVSDALVGYEAGIIIGDALTDTALMSTFPSKQKRTRKK